MVFFFCMLFQIGFAVVIAIGFTSWGCGWITTIGHISEHIFAGIVMMIPTIGYSFCAAAMILLFIKVHGLYRATGASMAKAQQEFQSGVMSNRDVQAGVARAATSAARSQFSNAATTPSGGRY